MTNEVLDFAALTVGIAILAFLWNLHWDVANLRERMARLEGLLEGFTQTGKPHRPNRKTQIGWLAVRHHRPPVRLADGGAIATGWTETRQRIPVRLMTIR